MGTGLGHYIPLVAYLGFWVMIVVSLVKNPLYGLYYLMPFLPYRTMRDHFLIYPLGSNMLTILIFAVIIGAFFRGKRLPPSKLFTVWLIYAAYLYCSMWLGTALGLSRAPLWLNDTNFVTWKDYILIPLVFVAASLVIEDRKAIRNIVFITAISLLFIDRASLMESLSHSWAAFDENKRDPGPLAWGANITAAFLAQFGMFFWGFLPFLKKGRYKLLCYALVAATLLATMYTFSRAAYLSVLVGVFMIGILKKRQLLIVLAVFLMVWQAVVPTAVRERVNMTENSNGQLEASAQERVDLWENAEKSFLHSPIVGNGYATFQLGEHVDNLRDTHNWYVKVAVETGIVGLIITFWLLQQMFALSFRLFFKAEDPLYKGLGLGLIAAMASCVIANFFGDRWTYLEITGLLWVLFGAAARANQLMQTAPEEAPAQLAAPSSDSVNPYMAYR
ncbi:hypothetical protein GCM10011507_29910 [Edaphobacter acidisoli]|uniref:O-antigen ligase-related domain-containing protein n=1 Tax=Edaphobacter acidisoli TaxID=2040573 RepID=A0A916RY77_9BACT|nr:O-antigen ligase family protein [Edaphobacter acidisoli]GGA76531.1 hypothetical protein GCM10011507_29910 [Edaphobacter acidisoli]